MKRFGLFRIPSEPKDVFPWLVKRLVLSLGLGGTLGYLALLIVALSLLGFLIGDYQANGKGMVENGNIVLSNTTQARETALKNTYQEVADEWQQGLSASQIAQVEQQQVDLPAAVLMGIGKMINNLNPPNAQEYYDYLAPVYTWKTYIDVTITYRTVCDKNGCHVVTHEVDTPVTMLQTANTWDGTLVDTYKWITSMSGTTQNGVYTKKIELASSTRTYDWSRVWNLFANIPTAQHTHIKESQEDKDILAGFIGAIDYTISDPEVQKMVTSVLFPGGVVVTDLPHVSTALPSGNAIQNILHYKADIEAAARMFNIPAVLIAGVMYQESGGNQLDPSGHVLTSSAGAMGLMQVEPSTAEGLTVNGVPVGANWYADLSNPTTNILLGAELLSELYHAFNENVDETLSAYNAGPGAEEEALSQGYTVAQNSQTLEYVAAITQQWIPALEPYFGSL